MNQSDYKKYQMVDTQTSFTLMKLTHKETSITVEGLTSFENESVIDLEAQLCKELKAKVNLFQEPEKTESIEMSSEVFESHKKVLRCPMSRLAYNIYRGWDLPDDKDGSDEGYLVEYLDGGKPNDDRHEGYISWSPKAQFDEGYTSIGVMGPTGEPGLIGPSGHEAGIASPKSLGNTNVNTAKKNVADLVVFGNGDMFKLISKASSKNEGWMKSTKGVHIDGVGSLVQVTTQQGDNVAEALQFMPGVGIRDIQDDPSKGREFYNMYPEINEAAAQLRKAQEKDLLLDRIRTE